MSSEDNEGKGFPIYQDPRKRKIVDAAGDKPEPDEWHPMNNPAKRLCKSVEGLRDLEEGIDHLLSASAVKKRRRRLRGVIVPLHSLCVTIVDLTNCIQSEKGIHSRLPPNSTVELTEFRNKFQSMVPFERGGKLKRLRDKICAHLDKNLSPSEMRDLHNSADFTEVGEWINVCLAALCDLLKLDAYMWTAAGPDEKTTAILCDGRIPIMSILELTEGDGPALRVSGIRGMYITTDPRKDVFATIMKVAKAADALFERPSRYRITGFSEDPRGVGWSSVLRSAKTEPQEPPN
ncbi:MAG: hypothetical protein WCV00_21355 [Verrucomicrobiia bacterium]